MDDTYAWLREVLAGLVASRTLREAAAKAKVTVASREKPAEVNPSDADNR